MDRSNSDASVSLSSGKHMLLHFTKVNNLYMYIIRFNSLYCVKKDKLLTVLHQRNDNNANKLWIKQFIPFSASTNVIDIYILVDLLCINEQ